MRHPRSARLVGISLGLAVAFSNGCSGDRGAEPVTIDFESSEVGRPPPGFAADLTGGGVPPSWLVRADPSSTGGGNVLIQESADETSYRFPLCIDQQVDARDVAVEVRFKAISGEVDRAGGIVLRYSPENYYVARANALEDNVALFKTEAGKRTKIEEVPAPVASGAWHRLRFEARGARLRVIFDGEMLIERDDATFPGPGKVGLWTKADSVSAFDDLKIERLR